MTKKVKIPKYNQNDEVELDLGETTVKGCKVSGIHTNGTTGQVFYNLKVPRIDRQKDIELYNVPEQKIVKQ